MTGFMRQRGSSWQLIVHAGRDPVTGKKRYVSRTVKGTKREAQRALAALVTQTGHGVPADTATTVSQLLDAWFAQARTDFSPSTVRETNGIIERYLKPGLGEARLDRLRVPEIEQVLPQASRRVSEPGAAPGSGHDPAGSTAS